MSELEKLFDVHLRNDRVPDFEREYEFGFGRSRFDFAWPAVKVAAEIEGGTWSRGRHSRGPGFELDCEKYNEAALDGWRVFRFTGDMVRDGRARRTMAILFARLSQSCEGEGCAHENTAPAPGLERASVWCPDCSAWVVKDG